MLPITQMFIGSYIRLVTPKNKGQLHFPELLSVDVEGTVGPSMEYSGGDIFFVSNKETINLSGSISPNLNSQNQIWSHVALPLCQVLRSSGIFSKSTKSKSGALKIQQNLLQTGVLKNE